MMLISGLIILALLAPVEPFKLSLKPPGIPADQQPAQQQSLLYPTQQYQQTPLQEPTGVKGVQSAERDPIKTQNPPSLAPALAPAPAPQPPALAYIIVRPFQPNNQYYDPLAYNRPAYPPQAPLLPLKQEDQGQQLQQQELQQGQQQLDQLPPKVQGKFSKLKSSFDKVLAKLTLGSSYQVVGEEIQQPGQESLNQGQLRDQNLNQNQLRDQSLNQNQLRDQDLNQSQIQIQSENQGVLSGDQNRLTNQNSAQQTYSDPYTGFDARKRSSY